MRKPNYDLIYLYIAITLTVLLSGCNANDFVDSDVRIRIQDTQQGHISRTYKTFTGYESETLDTELGQIVHFDYEAQLNKGSLIIEWQDPNGTVIWRKVLVESERGNEDMVTQSPGRYRIIIQGTEASSNLHVSWKLN